jgi:hypothetical protein
VWYYSKPAQLEELLGLLNEEGYETDLAENLKSMQDDIIRQMDVTRGITQDPKSQSAYKTYVNTYYSDNMALSRVSFCIIIIFKVIIIAK